MCTNICILIKVYDISPILYFLGKLSLAKTPLNVGSFWYFFNFKICQRIGWFKKIQFFSITGSYNFFSFSYSQNQLLQFLYRIINFLARLIPECLLVFLKILVLVFLFHFQFFSNSFVQNIRIFKSLNDFHYVILFLFVIIKVVVPKQSIFFWIPASIAGGAAVLPNGAKLFFAKGTATFVNQPVW